MQWEDRSVYIAFAFTWLPKHSSTAWFPTFSASSSLIVLQKKWETKQSPRGSRLLLRDYQRAIFLQKMSSVCTQWLRWTLKPSPTTSFPKELRSRRHLCGKDNSFLGQFLSFRDHVLVQGYNSLVSFIIVCYFILNMDV